MTTPEVRYLEGRCYTPKSLNLILMNLNAETRKIVEGLSNELEVRLSEFKRSVDIATNESIDSISNLSNSE